MTPCGYRPACVSRASQRDMAIKVGNGKMRLDLPRVSVQIEPDGFEWLEIKSEHLLAVATLPSFADHKDPFGCLLVAQDLTEPLTLLTVDRKLARYGATVRLV